MTAPGIGIPLAPSQETLWEYMSYFCPDNPADARINVMESYQINGDLDVAALTDAVTAAARRQDALRLRFADLSHNPTMRLADVVEAPFTSVDLRDLNGEEQRAQVWQMIVDERYKRFDFLGGPLWSVLLVRMADASHILTVTLSHAIADGASLGVLLGDIRAFYLHRAARAQAPLELPVGFVDLTRGHAATQSSQDGREDYWRSRLADRGGRLIFPVTDSGAETALTHEAMYPFAFPRRTVEVLPAVSLKARIAPFAALLGAYAVSLALTTGLDDLIIGTVTAGRDVPGSQHLVGQFTNNVYVSAEVRPGVTVGEAVRRVANELRLAVQNVASFKTIAAAANPTFHDQRPWPFFHLYDAWFQQLVPHREPEFAGFAVKRVTADYSSYAAPTGKRAWSRNADVPSRLPIWMKRGAPAVMVNSDGSGGFVAHSPRFYSVETVAEIVSGYLRTLSAFVDDPDRRVEQI